jgi:hypothetical protein
LFPFFKKPKIMKHLKTVILILFVSVYGSITSQTFQDTPSGETEGNFPSKWELTKGSADIKTFEGQQVIHFGNKSIITPLMDSKNYLSDTFRLEFDAYFDIIQNSINYQYYSIRFWDGHGAGEETTNLGKVVTLPLKIARHGAILEHNIYSSTVTKETHKAYKFELEGKEATWRHILIDYNKSVLKVSIDGILILNIQAPKFSPSMISIEGVYIQYNVDFMRAIKNVELDGIDTTNTDSNTTNTSDNDQTDTDNTNTNIQTENYAYTFPTVDGNSGQILQTDGNGTVNWVDFPLFETEPHTHENTSVGTTNSETSNSGSGLEAIDEGNGIGWRLIGSDPANYGNIGVNAIDLSRSFSSNNLFGATGGNSFAAGLNAQAIGIFSKAIGSYTNAVGTNSSAIGNYANSRGDYSMALGDNIVAQSFKSFALGTYNVISGTANAWIETEPLLVIGNGIDNANRSNALTVLKNGTITAPSFDVSEITDPKALITKEYADANYSTNNTVSSASNTGGTNSQSSGLEAIDEGNGIGWRLKGRDPNNYGNIGLNAVDLSLSNGTSTSHGAKGENSISLGIRTLASGTASTAMGLSTIALGDYSIAMGENTKALSAYSFASGLNTEASGNGAMAMGLSASATNANSIAIGVNTLASGLKSIAIGHGIKSVGESSTAMGTSTIASGKYSTVMGNGTKASGENSTATGNKTEAIGESSFTSGSETKATKKYATAMGYLTEATGENATAIGHKTSASGIAAIAMGSEAIASGTGSIALGRKTTASGMGSTAMGRNTEALGENSAALGNYTQANAVNSVAMGLYTTTVTPNSLVIGQYNDDYGIKTQLFQIGNGDNSGYRRNAFEILKNGNGRIYGNLQNVSDRRLKTNISSIKYGLSEVLKLNPVNYNWKNRPEEIKKSLGLIAQEVQPIISEIVTKGDDKNQTLSVSYTELIPVLIKAIQEQQSIINIQNKKIDDLTADSNSKDNALNAMNLRIHQIESILKNEKL